MYINIVSYLILSFPSRSKQSCYMYHCSVVMRRKLAQVCSQEFPHQDDQTWKSNTRFVSHTFFNFTSWYLMMKIENCRKEKYLYKYLNAWPFKPKFQLTWFDFNFFSSSRRFFVKFTALPSFIFFPFGVHPFLVHVCMISRW